MISLFLFFQYNYGIINTQNMNKLHDKML